RWPRVLHIASEGTSNEFTPNGKHFVTREWSDTGSSDEEVVLWDAAKHIPLKKTSRPYVERRHFEFTSDGRFYLERGDSPHDINLRDIATTELVHKFSHAAEVTARALSPDDSTCLAATKGGWIHLWDLRSGRKLMAVDVGLVHVLSLDYRPDARQCLLGTKDGIAVTLDLPSGATGVRFENTETGEPTSGHAKFSPDGSRVVIESAGNEFHQASLWNAVTGERLQLLASPPSHNIWLSPNGRWALCVPWHTVPIRQRSRRIEHWAMLQTVPNRIELRDTSTGNVAHVFKGFGRYWHDNGSPSKVPREYRITWPRSKHDLGIVEPLMPQTSESFKTAIFLDAVFEFSPSQREVIRRIEGLDDVAREWLLGMISSEIVSDQSEVQRIRLKQKRLDGSYADRPVSGLSSAPVAVVENSERVLREFTDDAVSTVGPANAVWSVTATAVNGEGTRVVIAYRNDRQTATKRLVTWDVESGRRLKEIAVTEKDLDRGWDIKSLAFSPDGRYLAIGFNYDTYLMDLTNNQRFHVADIRDSLSANVEFVSFSPDGRRVVCADEQRSLWDIPNRKKLAELKIDDSRPNPIFSPNGKFVAMLSNRAFHFWDAETGEKQLLDQQGYHAGLFQFSPDGKRFLGAKSAGKDHEYRVRLTLWDFQNGKELAALYNAADPREIVRGAVFTPDGERLVTTYPNRLAVWDVTTGKQISSHTNPRREFEFQGNQQSPVFIDDRTLITVHHTGATRWDLDTGQPIVDYPTPRSRRTSVRLGSGDRRLLTVSPGRHAALWDIKSGRKLLTYADVPADLDFQFDAIRLSSDNRELFVVHRQGEAITVWDAESGRMTKRHFLLDRGREWVNEHHEK
ncbi:MAG: WD40 repeat domain-containing protein, partial [Planctomycetota bacterium]|nr:WD40 repeat domain-containing protein [Planctomycetota bacterium]